MLALIDFDLVIYRVGYTTEEESEEIAFYRANEMIEGMLAEIGAGSYQGFISDSENNFRKEIFPDYKANRTQPKPKHYQVLKDYLFKEWNAILAVGQEADDSLGIEQCTHNFVNRPQYEEGIETAILSIDKDLLQIPGTHYNFVKKEKQEVSEEEGMYWFYKQLLMGDPTDNIKGCPGIGAKKAEKALQDCNTDLEYIDKIKYEYGKALRKEWDIHDDQIDELITMTGQLIWIRREPNQMWSMPSEHNKTTKD
jgi:5'-3' exonuclease